MKKRVRAAELLDQYVNLEKTRDFSYARRLERMKSLLALMGSPDRKIPRIVLVAGTKGKGSTAAMIEVILRQHGLRTGFYSSPHLIEWHERLRINGICVTSEICDVIVNELHEVTQNHSLPAGRPTYFEMVTALAFIAFQRARVDVGVLEVGLGGEFDATNAADPHVSVITPLGMDHTEVLGPTLQDIARAKCGILRRDVPCVVGSQDAVKEELIRCHIQKVGAKWVSAPQVMPLKERRVAAGGQEICLSSREQAFNFFLPLIGRHQAENAQSALAAAEVLLKQDRADLRPSLVRQAFAGLDWPGRIQEIRQEPRVIVDSAHSAESATVLVQALKESFECSRVWVLCGMLKDKDARNFFGAIHFADTRYMLVPIQDARSFDPVDLARQLSAHQNKDTQIASSFTEGYEKISEQATVKDLVVITGSVYLAGEALRYFHEKH